MHVVACMGYSVIVIVINFIGCTASVTRFPPFGPNHSFRSLAEEVFDEDGVSRTRAVSPASGVVVVTPLLRLALVTE
jgi:hypothetical protein